jgi:Chitobiase/beta-hexosaminidase C-terminal domain
VIRQGENNVILPLSLGVDLTGATVEVVFKRGFYDFKKTATITDTLKGLAEVKFFSNDFRDWGKWKYQVSIIKGTDETKLDPVTLPVGQGVGEIITPPDQTDPPPTTGTQTVFQTLAELEATYPNGINQRVFVISENAEYYWNGDVVTEPEPDTTAPNNVTNLVATPSQTSVQLSWTASTSTDGITYEVWRGLTLVTTISGTSYNVTGLTASTLYNFTIKAKDSSGNISSGVSVSSTTTSVPVTDTTPPVLTITPAGTFTDTKQVTMSTNETATIWYTLDDSDPKTSGTKIQYTAPLTLTATDTVKAYAVDSANNESVVQTVTYTKEVVGNTTLASDDFNRADETLTTTSGGQTWFSGNAKVISNQVGFSANTATYPHINVGQSDNIAIEMDVILPTLTTGTVSGVSARVGGTSNNQALIWGFKSNGTKIGLVNTLSGASSVPVDMAFTAVAGQTYRFKIEVQGNVYKCYLDDVLKMTYTDTNSINLTSTKHGFVFYSTNVPRGDNFKITTI